MAARRLLPSRRSGKGSLEKEYRKGIPFGHCRLRRLRMDLAVANKSAPIQWLRLSVTHVIPRPVRKLAVGIRIPRPFVPTTN
jgi:hypothetical protein